MFKKYFHTSQPKIKEQPADVIDVLENEEEKLSDWLVT